MRGPLTMGSPPWKGSGRSQTPGLGESLPHSLTADQGNRGPPMGRQKAHFTMWDTEFL